MISSHYIRFLCVSLLLSSRCVTAQSTTQCQADQAVIYANLTTMNITIVEPDYSCAGTSQQECKFDFVPLNSNFINACTNTLQGVIFLDYIVVRCHGQGNATNINNINRTLFYDNSPGCYAQSCNEYESSLEAFRFLYPLMERHGLECSFSIDRRGNGEPTGSGQSNASYLIANFAVSGIVFVLVMILSSF